MKQRAVITGLGVLAANGIGLDAFWESLLAGRSGIAEITLFDTTDFPVKIAGEIKGFDVNAFVPAEMKPQRMGRHTHLAIAAAKMAIEHARLSHEELEALQPVPLFLGVSTSAIDVLERGKERMIKLGPRKVSPFVVTASQPQAVASALGEALRLQLQSMTVSSACSAGLQAVAAAMDHIASGRGPLILTGGVDAPITPYTVASFGASKLIEAVPGDPSKISRPFDRDRTGGVMAEGAGMLVLESLDHARARGATIWAEIRGHATAGDPRGGHSGDGFRETMRLALANALCMPADIDYICAHGPSDPEIDIVETEAIKFVFGEHAHRIPVSSIKGCTGNPLSAAGPLQIAAAAMALRTGIVPPTANHEHPDLRCDLDYVPGRPRHLALRRALVNVHGLGGGNTSLVLERVAGS